MAVTWVRLKLTLPKEMWAGGASRVHPDASIRLLGALSGEDVGQSLVSIVAPDPEGVLESIAAHKGVEEITVLQRSDDEATVQIETTQPMVVLAAKRSGLPVEPPIKINNGKATITVAAVEDRVRELGRRLDGHTLEYEVEFIDRPVGCGEDLLTDTQTEILGAAIESGYYEQPRQCTLTELAKKIGVAKSTASETLRSAEATLVKQFTESASNEPSQKVVA